MKIIAVANHKGGVAKTATTHALGETLAATGRRVLMIDADPQTSLTQAAGAGDCEGRSLAEVLGGSQPGRLPMAKILIDLGDGLALAPGDIELSAAELGLVSRLGRESVLKKAMATVAGRFDVALIDCPPSLGLLTVGSLVAADGVLIPTQAEVMALRGLRLFLDTLDTIKSELNQTLQVIGILPTFYDGRLKHHQQAVEFIESAGLPLLPVRIGRSVRVAEAAGSGRSIVTFDPGNPQAEAYTKLGKVIEQWLNDNPN